MKKEMKTILILSLFCLILISFIAGTVSAQNAEEDTLSKFLGRWAKGEGLEAMEAKVLLLLLIFVLIILILTFVGIPGGYSFVLSVILSFIFTAYTTPDAILGIFKSYEAVPLTIATILPLLLFFGLTYLSVQKESRTLMTLQIIAWFIYFLYACSKPVVSLLYEFGAIDLKVYSVPAWGTVQASYFWFATAIIIFISGIMAFRNGYFMNLAVKWTQGAKDTQAIQTTGDITRGMRALEEVGEEVATGRKGGKKIK